MCALAYTNSFPLYTFIVFRKHVSLHYISFITGPPLIAPKVDPNPASGSNRVALGASVTVRCTSNVPYPIFTWQRLHAPYELPAGIVTYRQGSQTTILSISEMQEDMYAQYLCKVRTPPLLNEGPLSTVFTIAEPGMEMKAGSQAFSLLLFDVKQLIGTCVHGIT